MLAVGHSARDTFQMLYDRGVWLEAKPFSIGFRIEHPRSLDRSGPLRRVRQAIRTWARPSTALAHHCSNGRTVYSFCMCGRDRGRRDVGSRTRGHQRHEPVFAQRAQRQLGSGGGDRRPSATAGHPLAGVALQRHWESLAFVAGGETYAAPGQRVGDFLAGRPSTELGAVIPSYRPGVRPTDLSACLPDYAIEAIREALPAFGRQIPGFDDADAVLTGVETRTSSPVRITRGKDFQSLNTPGLYPAGEGAGYAGGILSAAVDGIKAAEAVALSIAAA